MKCENCGCEIRDTITLCDDCYEEQYNVRSWRPEDDEDDEDYYDESMDGDFDSAMTSAGWGTDEDYGYFGGDE